MFITFLIVLMGGCVFFVKEVTLLLLRRFWLRGLSESICGSVAIAL